MPAWIWDMRKEAKRTIRFQAGRMSVPLGEWHVTIWRAGCNEERSPDWRSPETLKVGIKGWEHTLEQTSNRHLR